MSLPRRHNAVDAQKSSQLVPVSGRMNYAVLVIVLGLATLTHGLYLVRDHNYFCDDSASYLDPAKNLRMGLGLVNNAHQPEIWRPPGYPFVLAIFLSRPLRLEYLVPVQHILCILIAVGVSAFALRVTGSPLIALVAGGVLSLDMATILAANLFMSDAIFTVFIAIACWVLYNTEPAGDCLPAVAAAGVLSGFAVLVRPAGVLYFAPLSLYTLSVLKRRALRPILLFTACFSLFPLLLAARNFARADYFGISTTGQYNLLANRAAGALAIQRPGAYFDNVVTARHELLAQACNDFKREGHLDCPSAPAIQAQQAAFFAHAGLNIILRNPWSYLRSVAVGVAYTMFGGGAEALSRAGHLSPRMAESIVLTFTVPEACLALLGCLYWSRRDRSLCCLLVLTVLYFVLVSAGAEAYSRYRIPVMPMYALLIGGGAATAVQSIRRMLPRTADGP